MKYFCLFSTYDRIRLQIFPWKKPEGYLNRPVYSQMLQSMLLYVISNPGISFKNISGRFLPYLLPFHVIELLKVGKTEILYNELYVNMNSK